MLSLFVCGAVLPSVEFPYVASVFLKSSGWKWK